jgi:hypothetical protein
MNASLTFADNTGPRPLHLGHLKFDNSSLAELPVETKDENHVRKVAGAVCAKAVDVSFMALGNICGIQRGWTPDHLFFTGLGLGQSEADPCQQPAHHRDQV